MDPTAGFALTGVPRTGNWALPDNPCGTHLRRVILPYGDLCTHGPDPAPPGVDPQVPRPLAGGAHPHGLLFPDPPGGAPVARTAQAAPGIGCYGDGTSGNRVQAVYAYPSDRPDRYDAMVASIRKWAAETDAVFQTSAAKTGGTRRIRYVTDAACNLSVLKVKLTPTGDDTFDNTLAEFQAQGLRQSNRHYLVWMDSTVLCGIASLYVDDRATADNINNGRTGVPSSVARIDSGCWGLGSRGQSVEAHELLHGLGGVQPTAPNGSPAGHCDDDSDRMCYQDGSVLKLLVVCPDDQEALFDCGSDDYFTTAPRAGSYLATHWNSADSSFLASGATNPTISIADAAIDEGHSGPNNLVFTLTVTPPATQAIAVKWTTGDGTATAPGDYKAGSGTLSFSPGQAANTISVPVNGDRTPENDETFTLTLSEPTNAILGRAQAIGTIVDDEPKGQGYWFVASDGGIFSYADSKFHGSTGAIRLNQPVVGMARTPSGNGYWLVARDGGIFSFGDARFFGSTGNIKLNQPIVGMAASPSGNGYWFVAADGGIFSFGDARFFGSTGGQRLARPIVGMASTPTGAGYWFVAGDGAVFNFGDARPLGSATGLGQPAVGLAATPTGKGYWVAGNDGALAAFGDAPAVAGVKGLARPVVGIAATPSGKGCWLVAGDGGIFSFGDARFFGSTGNIKLNQPIVGMDAAPGPR
jgi:ribosomal protein L24E